MGAQVPGPAREAPLQQDVIKIPAWVMNPEHVAAIGGALWVLLFLLQRADETGRVFQGEAVPLELIAARLEISVRGVKRRLKTLRDGGYIDTERCPAGGVFIAVNLGAKSGPEGPARGQIWPQEKKHKAKSGPEKPAQGQIWPREGEPGAKSGPEGLAPPLMIPPCKVLKDLFLEPKRTTTTTDVELPVRGGGQEEKAVKALSQSPEASSVTPSNPVNQNLPGPWQGSQEQQARQRVRKVLARIDANERPELTRRLMDTLGRLNERWLALAEDACWEAWRKRAGRLTDAPAWWHAMLERKGRQALMMQAQEKEG